MLMISFLILGFALAHPGMERTSRMTRSQDKADWSDFSGFGKCKDDCLTFVTCLYDTKGNYTEGHDQVKARDLTWDCMWSIDDYWIVEKNLHEATKCSMKVYANADRDDVEQCYADNVYGPAFGAFLGGFVFQCVAGVMGLASLIAISCAHCRCYRAPQNYNSTGFCCCKFFCPLAAVISADRYQDTTAIAALFSWCGCVYTMCCWKPKGVELGEAPNAYNQMPPQTYPQNQSRNVNWGV